MTSERALRLTHDEWERKVEEQANDLVKVNEELHGEIAERVRVEDALREISARLAEAHRRAKMTYWEWSKETDETTYRRDAYAGIRGVPFEDASYSYEETYAYIHPDDRDRVKACYERADADGASFEIDYRIHHVDGSLIYVREIGKAVYNEAGEFTGHTGTQQDVTDLRERDEALRKAHDELEQHVEERTCELSAVNVQLRDEISERKRAEEVLCESERGLANAQRIAQMGNWEWNIEANHVHWSDELYRIFEIDPEAFGGTPKDFFALVHPDDQENFLDWNDAELSQDGTYFREFRIVVPDGRTKTIQTHAEITYDGNGKAIRVLGTDQDITERKRAEEALHESEARLREATRLAGLGYFVWDDVIDRCIYCSDEFAAIHGVSADEFIGLNASVEKDLEWVHPDDRERYFTAVTGALERQEDTDVEYRLVRRDGVVRHIHERGRHVVDDLGVVVQTIGTIQDITERKRAEDQIKASLEEKEVLLNEIHHRVKNNLQVISSMLWLQGNAEDNAHTQEVLQDCYRRVMIMAQIHESLHRQDDLNVINASDLLNTLVTDTKASGGGVSEHLSFHVDIDEIPLDVDHANAYGQIVSELISNSLKHGFVNGQPGSVEVSLHRRDEGMTELIVADDGKGLPEDFDLQQTKTLGLHLVRSLAAKFEGEIKIDGSCGTRVQIIFPEQPL